MSLDTTVAAAHGAAVRPAPRAWRRQQAVWLLACCALVFAMVVLGGVTRLTGSGLSMVDWEPISGVVPPIGDAAWAEEFDRYQASPEFRDVNYWMSVDDFKRIFYFEWAHRVLGRTIGLVFALPFVYFLARGRVPRAMAPRYAAMFVLGGLQGLLGWYMVKSGLVDDPHVSQYRLSAHLAAAVVIYAYMLWTALGLLREEAAPRGGVPAWARGGALALALAVFVTMMSGAFVAGLEAGLVHNTFPLMSGQWIPGDLLALSPAWRNAFENVTAVQFNHRVLALATFCAIAVYWGAASRTRALPARRWVHLLALAAAAQVALGIATLLLRVPVALGAAHQAGALVVLSVAIALNQRLRGPARSAPASLQEHSSAAPPAHRVRPR